MKAPPPLLLTKGALTMKTRLQLMTHLSPAAHQKQVIDQLCADSSGRVATGAAPIVAESRLVAPRNSAHALATSVAQLGLSGFAKPSTKQQKQRVNQLLANPNGRLPTGGAPIVAEVHRVARQGRVLTFAKGAALTIATPSPEKQGL